MSTETIRFLSRTSSPTATVPDFSALLTDHNDDEDLNHPKKEPPTGTEVPAVPLIS